MDDNFGFKKVAEDKNTITLKHPRGHEIKINKAAALNMNQGVNASEETGKLRAPEPQAFADGGEADPTPTPSPTSGGGWSIGNLLSGIFGGGGGSSNAAMPNPSPSEEPPSPPPPPPDQTQEQAEPPSLTPSNYQLQAPQAQNQGQISPNPMPDPDEYQRNVDQYQQGLRQEAEAQGKMGQARAQAAGHNIQAQQQALQTYQDQNQHFMTEAENAAKDAANTHIDPQMGGHEGLGTAIGLILGGIGGGLTHQENPVLKYINAEKERSIASQQANLNNKNNLVNVYTKLLGNNKDATDMTMMVNNSVLANKFEEAAGQSADPQAKARALQAASLFRNQNFPIAQQMTIRRQLLGQMNQSQQQGGGMGAPNPSVASRFLSPDPETNKAAQGEIKQQQNINAMNSNAVQSFDRVANMQNFSSRFGSPVQSSKRIDAEWEPMMDKLTKNNEGRVTPITVDLMSSLKPMLSDNAQTVSEKREKLLNILNSERATPTLDSIGISVPKNIGVARTNPNAPENYRVASR